MLNALIVLWRLLPALLRDCICDILPFPNLRVVPLHVVYSRVEYLGGRDMNDNALLLQMIP